MSASSQDSPDTSMSSPPDSPEVDRPLTPPPVAERDILWSSPSSKLPKMPEESRAGVQALIDAYQDLCREWRHGTTLPGPHFLGIATDAEAAKFESDVDRRLPVMVLPAAENDKVLVYLVGDPTLIHAKIANWIGNKIMALNLEGVDGSLTLDYLEDFHEQFSTSADGKMTIKVWEPGQIKARRFSPGFARKEPDMVFHTGDGIPTQEQRAYCVLEIAYGNEDVVGLILEAKLWTECTTSTDTRQPHNPLNFLGIKIEEKRDFKADQSLPAAIGIIILTPAGKSEVVLMNASSAWQTEWEQALRDEELTDWTVRQDDIARIPLTSFFPPAAQDIRLRNSQLRIDQDKIMLAITNAKALEDERNRSRPPPPPPPPPPSSSAPP
ncbi:unnamed protein product [Sympodiomycopsis kandeliae]